MSRQHPALENTSLRRQTLIRKMSETPTTTTSQKSIAIHLQFVLQYASNLYCSTSGTPSSHLYRSTPPICIAICLPFVSQYASHLYRNTFGKVLVVVVTGMFPSLKGGRKKWERARGLKTSEDCPEESNLPRRFRRYPEVLKNPV